MAKSPYTLKQAKAAADATTIRMAFFRKGITEQYAMAAAAGLSSASMSKGMKEGFSPKSIRKIHEVVCFADADLEKLLCRP
jgi:hypothetical protein